MYDYPDRTIPLPPVEYSADGQPVVAETDGPQLKDFQLTGLNWLAYCWSRTENGILADEVCVIVSPVWFARNADPLFFYLL